MAWLRNKKTGGWFEIPDDELNRPTKKFEESVGLENRQLKAEEVSKYMNDKIRNKTSYTKISVNSINVNGENNYKFTNGTVPRGMGNWAFTIGNETVWFNRKLYADAKKEAKKYASKKGIYSIKLET